MSVPQAGRMVVAPRGNHAAIRAKCNGIDRAVMSEDCAAWSAGGHFPQQSRSIMAAGQHGLTVWAEGHGPDQILVPRRLVEERFARGRMPKHDRTGAPASHQRLAVGTKSKVVDGTGVGKR